MSSKDENLVEGKPQSPANETEGGCTGPAPASIQEQPEVVEATPVETVPGLLELIYGVLFEPAVTMKKVAQRPPLLSAFLIITIIGVFGALMGILTASRVLGDDLRATPLAYLAPAIQALTPLAAILGLIWGYVKWFSYSAIIHLVADLLGGRGGARGVFALVALAGLPSIFMIPVQFLTYYFGPGHTPVQVLVGLTGLGVWVWSVILLVIGLREVHGLSTGRTLLVVFSPYLVLLLLLLLLLAILIIFAASLPFGIPFPGYL